MSKIAFLTTVFPENEMFLIDFFNSLKNQTYKEFDLIIVNDGLQNFNYYNDMYSILNIIIINSTFSPVKNREIGINYCIDNKYDFLIFGDSDDYFENNRVEKSLELLKENDIVVNDLSLFDDNGIYERLYLSHRLNNLEIVNFNFIKDKNIFGLSNTSIRLKNLTTIVLPDDLIALDWYIFSMLLMAGKKAIFTNETVSYYRQHQQNTVGLKELNTESFKKGVIAKQKHYNALNQIEQRFNLELIRLDTLNFNGSKNITTPLWWELI